ncbi:MAG TPA: hypothetical protein VM487_01905, partial [Phycisphaerae bacterium]|nr:hypothetical protein [Phycisphaerae bacterium]
YEVALTTGLRANELRSLTVDDLDAEGCGLHLHAEWTKNRRPGFQALPAALVTRLKEFIGTGTVADLYRVSLRRKGSTMQVPENPLLYVGTHMARELDASRLRCGPPRPVGRLSARQARGSRGLRIVSLRGYFGRRRRFWHDAGMGSLRAPSRLIVTAAVRRRSAL